MNTNFQAGSKIDGYVLDAYVGGGSFGVVWRGHVESSGEPVAIKLLTGALSSGDSSGMRADVEVLAAAAVGHSPHIVQVLGGGSYQGVPYIVMEYIEGTDLQQLLQSSGSLSIARTIDVGLAISDALRSLWEAGIIHRDIKPANVIDQDGVIRLADFGIARIVGYETVTMAGQAAMTMAYAAPEIWDENGPFGHVSHRSDLYAMGVLLYQCLVGYTPFRGDYGSLLRAHMEQTPDLNVLPAETPPSLRSLLRQCLEKYQEDRPRDAAECTAILQRAQAQLALSSGTASFKEPPRLGPWIVDSPHESVAWAWRCHNASGETATVEVLFADNLDFANTLRRTIEASARLSPLGAERVLESSRLLLHPDESWWEPPTGRFQFWVAREDKAVTPASQLSEPALRQAARALITLIEAAARESISLDLWRRNLSVMADGSVYVRRPGLAQPEQVARLSAIAVLHSLALALDARRLLDSTSDLATLAGPVDHPDATVIMPADATQLLRPTPPAESATTFVTPVPPTPAAATPPPPAAATPMPPPVAVTPQPVAAPAAGRGMLAWMELRQVKATGAGADYEVVIRNRSDRMLDLDVDASDTGNALSYFLPHHVSVRPSSDETLNLHVEPRRRRSFGGRRSWRFQVIATGGSGAPPLSAAAELSEQPPFKPIFALLGVAVIGIAAAAGAFILLGNGTSKAKDQPSGIAGVTVTVAPTQSVATTQPATAVAGTPTVAATQAPPTATITIERVDQTVLTLSNDSNCSDGSAGCKVSYDVGPYRFTDGHLRIDFVLTVTAPAGKTLKWTNDIQANADELTAGKPGIRLTGASGANYQIAGGGGISTQDISTLAPGRYTGYWEFNFNEAVGSKLLFTYPDFTQTIQIIVH